MYHDKKISSSTSIALFGATGRLGQAIVQQAALTQNAHIQELIAHAASPLVNQPLPGTNLVVHPFLQTIPDVLLDVSVPQGFTCALQEALRLKKPLVSGVTGLSIEQHQAMLEASQTIPVFYTPNFSLGMAILRRLTALAASWFYPEASVDLIERHHQKKRDKPSGSALLLKEACQVIGKQQVTIHSVRSGAIVGEHQLILNTEEEELQLLHVAHSRQAFARGALLAACFIVTQPAGLYSMEHLCSNTNDEKSLDLLRN